jgi:hypothetical protein
LSRFRTRCPISRLSRSIWRPTNSLHLRVRATYLLGDWVRGRGEVTANGVVVETATWAVGIAGLVAALAGEENLNLDRLRRTCRPRLTL